MFDRKDCLCLFAMLPSDQKKKTEQFEYGPTVLESEPLATFQLVRRSTDWTTRRFFCYK